MIIHTKYIAVTGKIDLNASLKLGTQTPEQVAAADLQNALYDHTKIVEWMDRGDCFAAILRTEAKTDEEATYLAKYQANRLSSFINFVSGERNVFDKPDEAMDRLVEMV